MSGSYRLSHPPRILFNANLYSPPAPGATPGLRTPSTRTLHQNIRKLKLDVAQHSPAHGRVGTHEEFMRLVTPTATARANWEPLLEQPGDPPRAGSSCR
jgi:hypothetical protein